MTRRHKILLLTGLYVAQGLPFGFFTQALPVFLRGGVSGRVSAEDVSAGFALTGHFLTERVLAPRDMKVPDARGRLLSYLRRP